jgi:hypothetical protein
MKPPSPVQVGESTAVWRAERNRPRTLVAHQGPAWQHEGHLRAQRTASHSQAVLCTPTSEYHTDAYCDTPHHTLSIVLPIHTTSAQFELLKCSLYCKLSLAMQTSRREPIGDSAMQTTAQTSTVFTFIQSLKLSRRIVTSVSTTAMPASLDLALQSRHQRTMKAAAL